MNLFKCKMCGGTIEFVPGETVGECDSCGTKQTLPKTTDETVANLFNRANNLRLKCEFDKAAQIYEKIVQQDDSEAEAHWGLVLCKYGIEYVEDPKDGRRVPTCHRTLYDAVTTDADYTAAIDYSDMLQQSIYEQEARAIDRIQKDILAVVKNEKPFDVFICYKETDENGRRTQDSALANDIYYQLTQEGFKVFYAAITLEDKLGQEYEPYIFAALQSAKVMLVVGTKPEYFNAVWVKNEWSRFLSFMKTDRSKLLIPCYRDMDAYELPEEFAHLQAQDMGKIGFVNDVVRGIKKVFDSDKPKGTVKETVKETVVVSGTTTAPNTEPLLKRAFMFLEDGDWEKTDEFCEQVLNQDPENVRAYLGKLLAEFHVNKPDELYDCVQPFDDSLNYKKILRFGSSTLIEELIDANNHILYSIAKILAEHATTEKEYLSAAEAFEEIHTYSDSASLAEVCLEKAETARKNEVYSYATSLMVKNTSENYYNAIRCFQSIIGWKDTENLIHICQENIESINTRENNRKYAISEYCRLLKKQQFTVDIRDPGITALCIDGTVFDDDDDRSKISNWRNIVAIASGDDYVLGVRSDGTVLSYGNNEYGQCNVNTWKEIIAIATGGIFLHTVGLRLDGTVVGTGSNFSGQLNISGWHNIKSIAIGDNNTIGLHNNGTVSAVGDNVGGRNNVGLWRDIIAIAAGNFHTVGLHADGTVIVAGDNSDGECDVSSWRGITAIAAGSCHTVGLCVNGTVVATGNNEYGQCNTVEWHDIIKIFAFGLNTVGICSDGTVVMTGLFCKYVSLCESLKEWNEYNIENTIKVKDILKRKCIIELQEINNRVSDIQSELTTKQGLFAKMKYKSNQQRIENLKKKCRDLEIQIGILNGS